MEAATRPVNVFVSYAHRDDRYRQKLHTAVSPLRRRNLIEEWYDAGIVGGDEVDAEILRRLAGADLVLLLLSPSYIDSDYCWNMEMPAALRLREHKDMRVVGIIVEPVHLDGLELTRNKLLPKDKKPIPYWHPQSAGWRDVCKGIEQVIDDLRHPSQVDDALEVPKAIIATAAASAQTVPLSGPAEPVEQTRQRRRVLGPARRRGGARTHAPARRHVLAVRAHVDGRATRQGAAAPGFPRGAGNRRDAQEAQGRLAACLPVGFRGTDGVAFA